MAEPAAKKAKVEAASLEASRKVSEFSSNRPSLRVYVLASVSWPWDSGALIPACRLSHLTA